MLRVTHPESDTAIFEYLDQNTNLGRLDYFTIRTTIRLKVTNQQPKVQIGHQLDWLRLGWDIDWTEACEFKFEDMT